MSQARGDQALGSQAFASVWFDCDSTLTTIEGIDELATAFRPHVAGRIAALTARAMDGTVPIDKVYGERLSLIAPTRAELDAIAARYVATTVPGAAEVVRRLRALGKTVGIVSGGLLPPVLALAGHLGVDPDRVHAVPIRFDAEGRYAGVATDSPLCRAGGKRELMAQLPDRERPAAFVGDGVTDLDTQGTVARFIGFGGVVRRPRVAEAAEVFVDGPSLLAILDLVLTPAELAAGEA